jgi:hypothetical protein
MFLQLIKLCLLALLVIVLTSCNNFIYNRDNYTKKIDTPEQNDINDTQNMIRLVRILEQNLSYEMNNATHQKTAFLKYNDNQNYSMYVLPDYDLIVEEPAKDLLYFSKNKAIFMRIELLSDDIDWNLLKKSTYAELTSLYMANPIETSLTDHFFESTAMYEVRNGNDIVTTYLINDPNIKLKLTMNAKTKEDHRDAFFQMAKTIMKENQMDKE